MQFADSILGEILTCSYVLFNAVPLIWCKVGDVRLDVNDPQAHVDKPSALTDRHVCAALHLIRPPDRFIERLLYYGSST